MSKFYVAGGGTYSLGASIGSTDSTILLSSFLEPVSGTPYTMALLNTDISFGTIGPKTTNSEFISFTGITQNADGSATLTGVVRGLAKKYPFTTDATFKLPHSGQTTFILSDAPQVFNRYSVIENAETITGIKTFATGAIPIITDTPTTALQAVNKSYVDNATVAGASDASTTNKGVTRLSASPNGTPTALTSISNASPAVFTLTAHGLTLNDSIVLTTTGALPTGLSLATTYYVIAGGLIANAFEVSASLGGSAINTSGAGSGTHSFTLTTPVAVGTFDHRVPTQNENDALVGTSGTPSSSNKFVTDADTTGTGSVVRSSVTNLIANAGYFGSGIDGTVVISGNTSLSRDMYYDTLTVNNGFTLNPNGYRIFVQNTLTVNGTIARTGTAGGAGGNGGAAQIGGGGGGGGGGSGSTGGIVAVFARIITIGATGVIESKGGAGGNGGNGSNGTTGSSGSTGTGGTGGTAGSALAAGSIAGGTAGIIGTAGAGGGGSASAGGNGSAGTNASVLANSIGVGSALLSTTGGNGGGATSAGGTSVGGGPASTVTIPVIMPYVPMWAIDLHTFNNGAPAYMVSSNSSPSGSGGSGGGGFPNGAPGNGGGGGGGAGGNGGTGGVIVLVYKTLTNSGSISVVGGAGGTGGTFGTGAGSPSNPGTAGGNGNTGTTGLIYQLTV